MSSLSAKYFESPSRLMTMNRHGQEVAATANPVPSEIAGGERVIQSVQEWMVDNYGSPLESSEEDRGEWYQRAWRKRKKGE